MVMNRANASAASDARREAVLGQMRCLAALAEWDALGVLCAKEWELSAGSGAPGAGGVGVGGDAVLRGRMAPLATQAAWQLGDWSRMEQYSEVVSAQRGDRAGGGGGGGKPRGSLAGGHARSSSVIPSGGRHRSSLSLIGSGASALTGGHSGGPGGGPDPDSLESTTTGLATDADFFKAVLAVHRGETEEARAHIAAARDALGAELAALVTESYDRSYGGMIRVQQLTELEEVIEYAELGKIAAANARGSGAGRSPSDPSMSDADVAVRRDLMRKMWRERIYGVQRNVEVWQALLAVRSLVLPIAEETPTWLKFASLNRKAGRTRQAHRTLIRLLAYDPAQCQVNAPGYGAGSGRAEVMLAYVKHQWALGHRRDAFGRLQSLAAELRCDCDCVFFFGRLASLPLSSLCFYFFRRSNAARRR